MGIYKFGNNTYPRRIRHRSNLGHLFRGKKCVLWAGKYGIFNTQKTRKEIGFKNTAVIFFLFCTMTNKCTINWQIITLLHVLTLSCHLSSLCKKLGKTYVKHLNFKLYYQLLHLTYLRNLARYWLQAVWGWHSSVETCSSV